jgi:modulator of FtsH protease HflK
MGKIVRNFCLGSKCRIDNELMTKNAKTFKIPFALTRLSPMHPTVYHQGPPDLEDWFKKIFAKLKPRRGPSLKDLQPPEQKGFNTWWAILPFVLIVSILLSGMVTVKPNEEVIVTRLGKYQATLMPGLHWTIPVLDRHTAVDMSDGYSLTMTGLMLTQDQYLVNANIELDYQVINPKTYLFASQNTNAVLHAYLQAASIQAVQNQPIANLLNKNNFAALARAIQNNLNINAKAYGIQIQAVNVNSIIVPNALNNQFMQPINQAEAQVKNMLQNAEAYKAALAPIAAQRAREIVDSAHLKSAAIVVAAKANVAEFNALLPAYQKDPAATAAYLPLLVLPDIKSLAPHNATNTSNPGNPNANSAQNAYNRWQSANQSQSNAQQSKNQ